MLYNTHYTINYYSVITYYTYTPSQRAVIAVDVMPMLEEEARKRQIRKPISVVAKLPPQNTKAMERKSSTQAGKLAQVGYIYHTIHIPY